MRNSIKTLVIAGMLVGCGDKLPLLDESQDENESQDPNRELTIEEQSHIGADGDEHFYPADNGIDVTFRGFSLLDSDEAEAGDVEGDDETEAVEEEENSKAAKKCGDWIGPDAKITKVTGNQKNIAFEPNSVIALFVAGNQNQVTIDLGLSKPVITDVPQAATVVETSEEGDAEENIDSNVESEATGEETATEAPEETGEEVAEGKYIYEAVEAPVFDGICLIMAGNQAKVDINVNGFAIGNFAMVARGNEPAVKVTMDKYAEIKNSTVDIRGNGGSLTIAKDGEYECPEAELKSKSGTITCE